MKSCPKCLNLSPDAAVACAQCGTVLDNSVISRVQKSGSRPVTIVETMVEPSAGFPDLRPTPPPAPFTNSRPAGRRGETVFMPPPAEGAETVFGSTIPTRTNARRIVAVLITYSWKPEGQLFAIREGRNLIGRGEECDIRIQDDPMLSQVNSHITFRQAFTLGDMVSMSGTDLNGEPVEEQFRPVANYARIRTGSTVWTFTILDQSLASNIG